ncbi:hypothetical protein D9M69_714480 [compost metagenome]
MIYPKMFGNGPPGLGKILGCPDLVHDIIKGGQYFGLQDTPYKNRRLRHPEIQHIRKLGPDLPDHLPVFFIGK